MPGSQDSELQADLISGAAHYSTNAVLVFRNARQDRNCYFKRVDELSRKGFV